MALVSWKTARVTRDDLDLLCPGNWLNDAVIGFWTEYLSTAPPPAGLGDPDILLVDAASANWMAAEDDEEDVADALTNLEVQRKKMVLVPVSDRQDKGESLYQGTHWALLALTREGEETCAGYYDSMGSSNLPQASALAKKIAGACDGNAGQNARDHTPTSQVRVAATCNSHVACALASVLGRVAER
mmetsp:Transcript_73245/g.171716  ORF Transcript_73245/g.171716 Transcript_73245/m.171716 type:complete len:187 (+) Transcript_73245:54-614(+)